jgi:SAM-dependent methyltransferase
MTDDRFTRYLSAKKSVDDRALNRRVFDAFAQALPSATRESPVRVLEIGAGIGTMIERLLSHAVFSQAIYTAVDADAANIVELNQRLPAWAAAQGFNVEVLPAQDATLKRMRFSRAAHTVTIEAHSLNVFDLVADQRERAAYDVLIAHAVLDLLDVPPALPQLLSLLHHHGLVYFTINFDGATIFEPALDPAFDAEIERLYHQTMDERITHGVPSGDSRTGRHLFHRLRENGVDLLAAGSSDWVVFGGANGYPDDEAYFLHFTVDTVRGALAEHPALASQRDRFAGWIAQRHQQIDAGTLVYIAHQLDFVGRRINPVGAA